MKVMLGAAAFAAVSIACGGAASASVCSQTCDHSYSVCSALNPGAAQPTCMPKWMQCKRSCTAAAVAPKTPTKVVSISRPGAKH